MSEAAYACSRHPGGFVAPSARWPLREGVLGVIEQRQDGAVETEPFRFMERRALPTAVGVVGVEKAYSLSHAGTRDGRGWRQGGHSVTVTAGAIVVPPGQGSVLLKERWWLPLSSTDTPGA